MKELSENVKAIDVVRQMVADGQVSKDVAEKYFPELKESEDEKIRKRLIEYFKDFRLGTFSYLEPKKIIDWLEKQGEQKSEWSEEDNALIENVCTALGGYALYERKVDNYEHADYLENAAKKLKSLRPQNRWKPSDEQMIAIKQAVKDMKESPCYDSELVSLFNDLKKLREG